MTWLKFINAFILQWFCVRLTKHAYKDENGNYTILKTLSIQYWVVPLTGWWSSYKRINKMPKFWYIYKKVKETPKKADVNKAIPGVRIRKQFWSNEYSISAISLMLDNMSACPPTTMRMLYSLLTLSHEVIKLKKEINKLKQL